MPPERENAKGDFIIFWWAGSLVLWFSGFLVFWLAGWLVGWFEMERGFLDQADLRGFFLFDFQEGSLLLQGSGNLQDDNQKSKKNPRKSA